MQQRTYLVAVSVHDSLAGVALCQALGTGLAIDVVIGTGVLGEVGALYMR